MSTPTSTSDATEPCYLLVTGGRHFAMHKRGANWVVNDDAHKRVGAVLTAYAPVGLLLTGGCRTGADMLAAKWSDRHGVPLVEMPARWVALGKRAGPARNGWLLEFAMALAEARGRQLCAVAFPGGGGTADMVKRCRAAGIDVLGVVDG